MNTTSLSLLARLRQPADQEAWRRFVHLYSPLLYYWARGVKLPAADAADLVQEVLLVVVEKLPCFTYDPARSFRGWLRTVTLNKWRERCRLHALARRRTRQLERIEVGFAELSKSHRFRCLRLHSSDSGQEIPTCCRHAAQCVKCQQSISVNSPST